MKPLKQALNDYLRIRRSLGFLLREPEGLLRNFVAFLQAEGASHITRELAVRWATQPAKDQPATWAGRLALKIHDFRNTEGLAMVQIRYRGGFETKSEAFT